MELFIITWEHVLNQKQYWVIKPKVNWQVALTQLIQNERLITLLDSTEEYFFGYTNFEQAYFDKLDIRESFKIYDDFQTFILPLQLVHFVSKCFLIVKQFIIILINVVTGLVDLFTLV